MPAHCMTCLCSGWLDLGATDKALVLFRRGYANAQKPFQVWTEGADGTGCTTFLTGAGGFLQSVWAGYGGVRFERDDALTIRSPRPLPNSTALRLRGVHYLGARLDIEARLGFWTIALSSASAESAPALELVMKQRDRGVGAGVPITHTPLRRSEGEEGYVRVSE